MTYDKFVISINQALSYIWTRDIRDYRIYSLYVCIVYFRLLIHRPNTLSMPSISRFIHSGSQRQRLYIYQLHKSPYYFVEFSPHEKRSHLLLSLWCGELFLLASWLFLFFLIFNITTFPLRLPQSHPFSGCSIDVFG